VQQSAAITSATAAGGSNFGFGTWLNAPIEAEVLNAQGGTVFTFASAYSVATFQIDTARHALPGNTVDTAVAEANFAAPYTCNIYGFDSHGNGESDPVRGRSCVVASVCASRYRGYETILPPLLRAYCSCKCTMRTGVPAFNYSIAECDSSLLYDDYRYIDISDDASTVAFAGFVNQTVGKTKVLTARAYVFNAQVRARVRLPRPVGAAIKGSVARKRARAQASTQCAVEAGARQDAAARVLSDALSLVSVVCALRSPQPQGAMLAPRCTLSLQRALRSRSRGGLS
jgi:hypothetical protein